jgi:hypothetical protein
MSVQNKSLGDVTQSPFDRLNLDSCSEAVLAFPHGDSKGKEAIGDVFRRLWAAG